MYIVGLDLGKRKSHATVGDKDGQIVASQRIVTSKESFATFFAPYTPARILIEASTAAEWVARHLEMLGHTVIVGDPRFAPMYAQFDRRIKTDARDARALFDANRLGAFHHAHRRSDERRDLRARLLVRAGLVRTRTRMAVQLRSLLESRGIIVAACDVENFTAKLEGLDVEPGVGLAILPVVAQIDLLNTQLAEIDEELEILAALDPVAHRLDDVVGVGKITALAFVAAVDDPKRFENARQVASFFGFVPRENSTGQREHHRFGSTKTGDTLTRSYLVQAAWNIRRSKKPEVEGLRAWADEVERRRGAKVATNALARRLVRILFALWRDGSTFDLSKLKTPLHVDDGRSSDNRDEHGTKRVPSARAIDGAVDDSDLNHAHPPRRTRSANKSMRRSSAAASTSTRK
jgi:transposase